jgi:hypothetical protein
MRTLLCTALLTVTALCQGAAPATSGSELPLAVKYSAASPEILAAARAKLRPALTDSAALATLLGPDTDETVRVGPFFGIEIDADQLKGRSLFGKGRYRLPKSEDMPEVISESFGAQSRPQKLLLAHYVTLAANFSGEVTIREPNFEELALVWAWIAWDLDGPLLVAESEHDKFFYDFDVRGERITWIERLTHPCFTVSQEGKQVLTCTCVHIERNERSWRLAYQVLESCPATGMHNVSVAANSSSSAQGGKLPAAYVLVSDRSARVDTMLARRFAGSFAITTLASETPGYKGPGKLLEGKPPVAPKDARGEPVHGYVLLGSAVGPDGRMVENRVLLSTDERVTTAVLAAAQGWRVEPPSRNGEPVTEIIWQELAL